MVRASEWYKGKKLELEPGPPEMLFRIMLVVRAAGGAGEELLQVQNCCQWKREEREIPAGVWLRGQDPQMDLGSMLGWHEVQEALDGIYDKAEAMPEGSHCKVDHVPAQLRRGLSASVPR